MGATDGRGWVVLREWADRKANYPPEKALEVAEKHLHRQIRIYGPDGGPTAVGRAVVASKLEALGRNEEARLLRQEVVAGYQRNLGGDHPYTLSAELALGINLTKSAMTDEARSVFTRVYEERRRVLGPEDDATKTAGRWLATLDQDPGSS